MRLGFLVGRYDGVGLQEIALGRDQTYATDTYNSRKRTVGRPRFAVSIGCMGIPPPYRYVLRCTP